MSLKHNINLILIQKLFNMPSKRLSLFQTLIKLIIRFFLPPINRTINSNMSAKKQPRNFSPSLFQIFKMFSQSVHLSLKIDTWRTIYQLSRVKNDKMSHSEIKTVKQVSSLVGLINWVFKSVFELSLIVVI